MATKKKNAPAVVKPKVAAKKAAAIKKLKK